MGAKTVGDYEFSERIMCECKRIQQIHSVFNKSYMAIPIEEAERLGWKLKDDGWYCPFCSGEYNITIEGELKQAKFDLNDIEKELHELNKAKTTLIKAINEYEKIKKESKNA
jgi:hypothetical protein